MIFIIHTCLVPDIRVLPFTHLLIHLTWFTLPNDETVVRFFLLPCFPFYLWFLVCSYYSRHLHRKFESTSVTSTLDFNGSLQQSLRRRFLDTKFDCLLHSDSRPVYYWLTVTSVSLIVTDPRRRHLYHLSHEFHTVLHTKWTPPHSSLLSTYPTPVSP